MSEQPKRERHYTWQDPQLIAQEMLRHPPIEVFRRMAAGEIPPPPIGVTLDFNIVEVELGRVVFGGVPQEYVFNPIGSVHGGYFATLLDSAMACAVHSTLAQGMGYTTVELSVNFIRPITLETGPIRCIGEVVHGGRRLATAEGRIVDANDKLYAHGTTTCMVFPLTQ